jgi:hypothetical protein
VIELAADGTKTGFNVAKTLAVGQLGEGHGEILIPAGQAFQIPITSITFYTFLKLLVGKELHQLRENAAPNIHPALSLLSECLPSLLLKPFPFQIVFISKLTYHTESRTVACLPRKFPRTAMSLFLAGGS